MLEKLGVRVSVANHGEEALQLCDQQPFDLIFMDCQMPVMDGLLLRSEFEKWESGGNTFQLLR